MIGNFVWCSTTTWTRTRKQEDKEWKKLPEEEFQCLLWNHYAVESLRRVESALFLGEEVADLTDELWFIYCDKKERIRRLVETRGYSKEKAVAIIANQPNDEDYNSAADEFIDNTGSFDKTIEQVDFALSTMEC